MAERNTAMLVAIAFAVALFCGATVAMLLLYIERDEAVTVLCGLERRTKELGGRTFEAKEQLGALQQDLDTEKDRNDTLQERVEEAKRREDTFRRGWQEEHSKVIPAIQKFGEDIREKDFDIKKLDSSMKRSRENYEADKRALQSDIADTSRRLKRHKDQLVARYDEEMKTIGGLRMKLRDIEEKLARVRTEQARGRVVNPDGRVLSAGKKGTNFLVVDIGWNQGVRKGMKFDVFEYLPGYSREMFQDPNAHFDPREIIPGDLVIMFPGTDMEQSVIIVRVAPDDDVHSLQVAGHVPSIRPTYEIRKGETITAEAQGVRVKAKVEIQKVGADSSEAVILPPMMDMPHCPQCGWIATKRDMRYCPYCAVGDTRSEAQELEEGTYAEIVPAVDALHPIIRGDYVSNPYFSKNQKFTVVLAGESITRSKRELRMLIESGGGVVQDRLTVDTNFLVPGAGPDAEKLIKQARDMGVKILREDELEDYFGRAVAR